MGNMRKNILSRLLSALLFFSWFSMAYAAIDTSAVTSTTDTQISNDSTIDASDSDSLTTDTSHTDVPPSDDAYYGPQIPLGNPNAASTGGEEFRNPVRAIKIEQIQFSGLKNIDSSRIMGSLTFKKGEELLPTILREKTRESIRNLYNLGWFESVQVDAEYPDTLQGVLIFVLVTERVPLGKIEVKGADHFKAKDLVDTMDLIEGQIISATQKEKARQLLLNKYKDDGYLLVNVDIKEELDEATGNQNLTFKIREGKRVKIRDVIFTGNTSVKSRKLRGAMETKRKSWFFGVGGEFKEDEFYASIDSVREYYRALGYLDASVRSHRVQYSTNKQFITLHLEIYEGRKYYMGTAKFIHHDIYPDRVLKQQMLLKTGEVANASKLDAGKGQVETLYRDIGYLFVNVSEEKTFQDSIVNITYHIEENNIAHIRKVDIRGNTKTRDKVIRREIRIFPGDVFSQTLVMRSFREVMQLNFFDEVRPNYEPVDNEDVDLVFDVKEREAGTGTFSAGAAYSARDALIFTLALQIPNLMGRAQRADVSLEFGENKTLYSLGFTEPWFMDSPTSVGGTIFWQSVKNYYYSSTNPVYGNEFYRSYGFRARLGRRLTIPDDYTTISSSYSFTQNDNGRSRNRDSLLLLSGLESSLGFTVVRDDKDLPIFATEGSRYTLRYTRTGGPLMGTFNYSTYEAKIQWWFPLVQKLVLEVESEIGVMDGKNLQQADLYQMGGMLGFQGKMRGYFPGSIGGDRIGRSFFSHVMQLRYPIVSNVFHLLMFYDMGNVFGDHRLTPNPRSGELVSPWSELDLSNLLSDYGAGIRINIPMVGIMGFDFGWPLSPSTHNGETVGDGTMQFNFVIEAPF